MSICTKCASPYVGAYQQMAPPPGFRGDYQTSAPCPLPPQNEVSQATPVAWPPIGPPQVTPVSPPVPPPFSPTLGTPLFQYQNVNALPVNYGAQGPNGNIVCGQRPLTSVREQPMWNPRPAQCVPTETKTAENVSNYDNYQSFWSVLNPCTQEPLPTLAALFHPQNIEFIKETIGKMLSQEFGFDIGIEDTSAFRQTISDVALDNPRWMYDVANGLPLLNEVIIKREFTVHQSAIRQQLLYEKYMIRNDRQKFMPYGVSEHVVKGETVIDPSSYTLNQTTPISYDCFLTQANLWCKK